MAKLELSETEGMSLDEVRWRIDAIDADLLRLLDTRAALARRVAEAKAAAGNADEFGLRPAREAQVIRRLIGLPRDAATPTLIARIWREVMSDNLARQGPYDLTVFGGRDPVRAVELARGHFGAAPSLRQTADAREALAATAKPGGVAVLSLASDTPWWGRLLAEPQTRVFAALPCLAAWGPPGALAAARIEVEPTGGDITFWVTDAPGAASAVIDALGRDGVAAELLAEAGGLRLFALAGFYQANDERLARAPGSLSGVIGAAPAPFDV